MEGLLQFRHFSHFQILPALSYRSSTDGKRLKQIEAEARTGAVFERREK